MAGTKLGGQKAAESNKDKYGQDFYQRIGKLGGAKSRNGGYASYLVGPDGLTGRERARRDGKVGGEISRRGPAIPKHASPEEKAWLKTR